MSILKPAEWPLDVMSSEDGLAPVARPDLANVEVTRCWQETAEIRGYELRPIGAAALLPWSPGSHIDVDLPGIGMRQYSLCNSSAEADRYVIAVKLEIDGRGGSRAIHQNLGLGSVVQIGKPRNNFTLIDGTAKSIFVAGGIGITPIMSMVDACHRSRRSFELHYFGRQQESVAFFRQLAEADFSEHVQFHFDAVDTRPWADRFSFLRRGSEQARIYVCGPAVMMDFVRSTAAQFGHDEANVHFESFGAVVSVGGERQFTMQLARSGMSLVVPVGKTALDVLIDHKIDIAFSCEQGVCGTCKTRVVDGIPDHRDQCLTTKEHAANDVFMPCCSRSLTETLTVDL